MEAHLSFCKQQITITLCIFILFVNHHGECDCAPILELDFEESYNNSVWNVSQGNHSEFDITPSLDSSGYYEESLLNILEQELSSPVYKTMENKVSIEINDNGHNSSEEIIFADNSVELKHPSIRNNFSHQTDHPELTTASISDQSETDTGNNSDNTTQVFLSKEATVNPIVNVESVTDDRNNSHSTTSIQSSTITNSMFENDVPNQVPIENDNDTASKQVSSSLQNPTSVPQMHTADRNMNSSENQNGRDEYVDTLYQSLSLHGAPDSFNEYDTHNSAVQQPKRMTVTGAETSSLHHIAPASVSGKVETFVEDRVSVTESNGSTSRHVATVTGKISDGYHVVPDPDNIAVQSNAPIDFPDRKSNDVIQLPNGVVIDALFDNIDSLQDLLDICEEGLRQRLVVHKDVFFGDSQELTETDKDVEIRPAPLSDNMVTHESAAGLGRNDELKTERDSLMARTKQEFMSTKRAQSAAHVANANLDLAAKEFDEEDGGMTTQGDSTEGEINANDYLTKTGVFNDGNEEMDEKGEDDHSYYVNVTKRVINRLSKRLKYLERSIEECNLLTESITKHEALP